MDIAYYGAPTNCLSFDSSYAVSILDGTNLRVQLLLINNWVSCHQGVSWGVLINKVTLSIFIQVPFLKVYNKRRYMDFVKKYMCVKIKIYQISTIVEAFWFWFVWLAIWKGRGFGMYIFCSDCLQKRFTHFSCLHFL